MKKDGLLQCSRKCIELKTSCPNEDCKYWIDYKDEKNCTLISIYENGPMTLRQIGERNGLSFARIKQIETRALNKIKKYVKFTNLLF
jgi:DNA-directed RNA polymerase sigma subunit (sigma70/sigma32)